MADCKTCKENRAAKANAEGEAMRQHRVILRLITVILILVLLLVGSNVAWLIYESQFEVVEESYSQTIDAEQGDGVNIVGGGDVIYGAESQDYND